MNQLMISFLAFTGGIFLAIQGGLNAQLGVLLRSSLLASLVAFICSATFAFLGVALSIKSMPPIHQLKYIPFYLWFSGALFSFLGISLYYYTIPKLGISTIISLGFCGQMTYSVIAGHFGWFGLPIEPLEYKRAIGVLAMVTGIFLINNK